MKKTILHFLIVGSALFPTWGQVASAQSDTLHTIDTVWKKMPLESFSFSGSVDTYFHTTYGTVETAPRTAFANLPGFGLGMVNFIASYTGEKSGFVADLFFGPRASDAVFNAPRYPNAAGGSSSHIINQVYAYYNISNRIKLRLGQFNTFLGYEVISPTMNYNYSTSYLFSYGPFSHTGILADIDLGKGWTGKLAAMNPTDFTEFNPFGTYSFGGQAGYTNDKGSVFINVVAGDQDGRLRDFDSTVVSSAGITSQFDITTGWNVSKKYYAGLNTSYHATAPGEIRMDSLIHASEGEEYGFWGLALYQKLTFNKRFSLGLRCEYFSEFKGGVGAIGAYDSKGTASVAAITLSGNYTLGNIRVIPEVRLDATSESSFTSKSSGALISTMPSFNLALIYTLPALYRQILIKKYNVL